MLKNHSNSEILVSAVFEIVFISFNLDQKKIEDNPTLTFLLKTKNLGSKSCLLFQQSSFQV